MDNTTSRNASRTGLLDAGRCVMRMIDIRTAGLPAWVVLTQLFIGLGWLRAAAEKVIDVNWWTGTVVSDFVATHQDITLGWYQPFIDAVVIPWAPEIALIVLVGQIVAGLSLVMGRRIGVGLAVGMFLNLQFLAAGAVAPSAFYLLTQGAVALWMAEQTPSFRSSKRLWLAAVIAAFLGGLSLPFISTLHPAEVIDDPAVMMAFGGALAVLACVLAGGTPEPARASAEYSVGDGTSAMRMSDRR